MKQTFWNAKDFNQNINNWDVSSVTNFESIFRSAEDFNQIFDLDNKVNKIDFAPNIHDQENKKANFVIDDLVEKNIKIGTVMVRATPIMEALTGFMILR